MATPAGQFRPWRMIMTFVVITVGLYSLVFFTSGSNTPKLGIDLQGGTRIVLGAQTTDNTTPDRNAMLQARDILERRVNGSGVAGAQIQIDGATQLVVTVPGTEDLTNLTRSAQLNFRPVLGSGTPYSAELAAAIASAAAEASATATGTANGTDEAGATATTEASVSPADAAVNGVESAAPTTAAAESSSGLRGQGAAVATTDAAATGAATDAASISATGGDAASTDAASTDAASTDAATAATGTADAAGPAAPNVALPSGGAPNNPTQPASSQAADWTTWQTAVNTAIQSGLSCDQLKPYLGLDDPGKPLISCDAAQKEIYLLGPTIIAGSEISSAVSQLSQSEGWSVSLEFKSKGFSDWAAYTTANIGKRVAFTLDGETVVAPTIQSAITTATSITGSFTQAEAVDLANSLKFGALPIAFERLSADSVSAELGLEYLTAGLIAGGIGLLLVVIYCLIYYRLLGVITILSLLLSFGLVYAVLVLLGRWIGLALDMSGVAGLIIAIGITADSFVVYFERLKDEVREGRTFRSAVPRGWARAKRTILSADAVSFLAAAILYLLAVGEVKGFAFTLGLSTVLDLVVVFLVTHPLVALASGNKIFSSARWSGLGAVAAAGVRLRANAAKLVKKES